MDPAHRYVIRGGAQGRERLRLLSTVMGAHSRALLEAAGVRRGDRCVDIGCGGGDVAFELAEIVGADGSVLGVDLDETKLDLARAEAAQRGQANITFEAGNVLEWTPDGDFDVAYARFLLAHLPAPGDLLRKLRRHIRPGGLMVIEDVDFRGHFAEPPCPALDRYVSLYSDSLRRRGGDPDIGPRLPALLRDAGFQDVQVRMHQPIAMTGGIKSLTGMTFAFVADALRADGVPESELAAIGRQLTDFLDDPRTVHGGPRVIQCWGCAPH